MSVDRVISAARCGWISAVRARLVPRPRSITRPIHVSTSGMSGQNVLRGPNGGGKFTDVSSVHIACRNVWFTPRVASAPTVARM